MLDSALMGLFDHFIIYLDICLAFPKGLGVAYNLQLLFIAKAVCICIMNRTYTPSLNSLYGAIFIICARKLAVRGRALEPFLNYTIISKNNS